MNLIEYAIIYNIYNMTQAEPGNWQYSFKFNLFQLFFFYIGVKNMIQNYESTGDSWLPVFNVI